MKSSFKDTEGREWNLAITIATVRRVRKDLDVDLLNKDMAAVLETVVCDPVMLCDVLFLIVEKEAQRLGVNDEAFGEAMGGDALEEGAKAFLGALGDFTPNPRDRARVGKALDTLLEAAEACQDEADKQFEKSRETLLKVATTGKPSSSSPESPELPPGASPSERSPG